MRHIVSFTEFSSGIMNVINDSDLPAPSEVRERMSRVLQSLTISRSYAAPEALSDGLDKRRLFDALMNVVESPDENVVDYRTRLSEYLSNHG